MQWSYESKKLDCAAKYLSWCPPWVRSSPEKDLRESFSVSYMMEDTLGLGRSPCIWWTLNPRYNFAYDIHRLNVFSSEAVAAVASVDDEFKHVRFDFVKNSPDLCAYMVALRCELFMKIVMPAVVPHSEEHRFLVMGRYEVGKGGNPHVHGFCVGKQAPALGGKLIMDVDRAGAEDCNVEICSDGDGAEDSFSIGVPSAGAESARLSSEAASCDDAVQGSDGDSEDGAESQEAVLREEGASAGVAGSDGVEDMHVDCVAGGVVASPVIDVGGEDVDMAVEGQTVETGGNRCS